MEYNTTSQGTADQSLIRKVTAQNSLLIIKNSLREQKQ